MDSHIGRRTEIVILYELATVMARHGRSDSDGQRSREHEIARLEAELADTRHRRAVAAAPKGQLL